MVDAKATSELFATHNQTATVSSCSPLLKVREIFYELSESSCKWRKFHSFKYIDINNLVNHCAKRMTNEPHFQLYHLCEAIVYTFVANCFSYLETAMLSWNFLWQLRFDILNSRPPNRWMNGEENGDYRGISDELFNYNPFMLRLVQKWFWPD